MAVNLDACIHCNLCVRACREVQVNDVIGMAYRGPHEKVVFDFDDPMGALDLRRLRGMRAGLSDRRAHAEDRSSMRRSAARGRPTARSIPSAPIAASAARSPTRSATTRSPGSRGAGGPANENRLCVKGRFGFDYVDQSRTADQAADPQARRCPRDSNMDPRDPLTHFREASWEEALDLAARGLQDDARGAWAAGRWPVSARPNARTRRPISSRSWSARASAPTMSITARGFATPLRWRR